MLKYERKILKRDPSGLKWRVFAFFYTWTVEMILKKSRNPSRKRQEEIFKNLEIRLSHVSKILNFPGLFTNMNAIAPLMECDSQVQWWLPNWAPIA